MKVVFKLFFWLFIFFLIPKVIFSVDISLSNLPAQIDLEPFSFIATISGAKNGNNYLKADLFKEGENKYFGETFNDSYWYSGPNYNEYKIATISSNFWTGEILVRVGNNNIVSGNYKLRLRRYTSSSNYDYSQSYDILIIVPTHTFTPTHLITPSPVPTSLPEEINQDLNPSPSPSQSYEKIYLSEVMVNPLNGEKEWIELYNGNDFEVNLVNWFIDDIENGGSSPKSFSLKILPFSYAIFNLPTSIFNNTGDNIRLLDFNKNLKDSFEYVNSIPGKTYGRISFENDDFCLQEPSKSEKNHPCLNPSPTTIVITKIISPSPESALKITNQPKTISYQKSPIKKIINFNKPKTTPNPIYFSSKGEVLGEKSIISFQTSSTLPLKKSFSFFSLSYSLISFFGIFLKLKTKILR